ncbi:MAG: class I SAM-dependent methyltransferase [Coprococcus sp.]
MNFQITEYCHHILEEYIEEGDICIDATAGNGGDTEFLCQKVGETGNVYAFDVQEMAIAHTRERLEKANLSTRAKLIQDGHDENADLCKRSPKLPSSLISATSPAVITKSQPAQPPASPPSRSLLTCSKKTAS